VQDKELYQQILGLALPWKVSSVELDDGQQEIRVHVEVWALRFVRSVPMTEATNRWERPEHTTALAPVRPPVLGSSV
jgi:hypothetical protein